jgi:hypothetical protein
MSDPKRARRAWRALEPVHGMIYFAPESQKAYGELGLEQRAGYFASRGAALGPVNAETIIATFYNFNPQLVRRCIPAAWSVATPESILAARYEAADAALERAFAGQVSDSDVADAAMILRRAGEAACSQLEGRPLFAAHAALPWPDTPRLVLWHAQTLLREYRGDGHVAALTTAELSGLQALVVHAGTGEVPAAALQSTRAWSDEAWEVAVAGLQDAGVIERGPGRRLTDEGRQQRQAIEDTTDRLAAAAYDVLTESDAERIVELGKRLSRAVVDAGLLPFSRN